MSDTAIRFIVLFAVVVVALVIAALLNRYRTPPHPAVRLDADLGDRPGIILFTSTTCSTCKDAIAFLEGAGAEFREVTEELEPQRFVDSGVVAVPVTVVMDEGGATVATFSGIPRRSSFSSAVRRAGLDR